MFECPQVTQIKSKITFIRFDENENIFAKAEFNHCVLD